MGKWTELARAVMDRQNEKDTLIEQLRTEKSEAVLASEDLRADLLSIVGRATAIKTLYNLYPENIKNIIKKYTDVVP